MSQVKIFNTENELNLWLEVYSKVYEIVDIQFQFAQPSLRRFMVWYKK